MRGFSTFRTGIARALRHRMKYPDNLCQAVLMCWNGLENMRAIGYVRVATVRQADSGVSLDAQVDRIRAMARAHDVELLCILVDAGKSSRNLDRPAMARVLELVRSRAVGMVIV